MSTTDQAPDPTLEAESKRRLGELTSRFPDRFSEEQIGEIRGRIERSVNLGRSLRQAELGNGDGPDLIVTALPPHKETA
jgi:hypothetical protein